MSRIRDLLAKMGISGPRRKAGQQGKSTDELQKQLDVAGVIDPSGAADLTNALVSLKRAWKEPDQRSRHLKNAAISGVSAIPFGDIAKALKARKAARGAKVAARSDSVSDAARASRSASDEASAARASKPGIDYSALIGNMADPDAMKNAQEEAKQKLQEESESRKSVIQKLKDSVPLLGKTIDRVKQVAGPVTKKIAGVVVAVAGLIIAMRKWTDHLIESRRHLAAYNGAIAGAMARIDVQKFRQNLRLAQETGPTTVALADAVAEFREAFQPMREDVRTIMNTLGIVGTKLGTVVVKIADALTPLGTIADILERWSAPQSQDTKRPPAHEMVHEIGSKDYGPNKPRDPLPPLGGNP